MKLSASEFDAQVAKNELRISFVGMSNIGKSYCAEKLGAHKHMAVTEIDDSIQNALNHRSMKAAAKWLGYPYQDRYGKNARKYLSLENQLTQEALDLSGNIILDTTGSVVYCDQDTLTALKKKSIVVLIDAGMDDIERLKQVYFQVPKPTIWGESYHKKWWQNGVAAMKHSYSDLLEYRTARYHEIADVILPTEWIRSHDVDVEMMWNRIRG